MGLALERTRIALTRVRWCAVLLAALVLTAPGSAQGPRLIDLGTLGGNYSLGVAINDVGQVVGYSEVSGGAVHAFRWDGANGMQDLGTLGGAYSCATAINRAGQVVGYSWVNESSFHAFIWDPVNGMQDSSALLAGASQLPSPSIRPGRLSATTATRELVASAAPSSGTPRTGCRISGTLGGAYTNALAAINPAGQVAGEYRPG